jgi:aminocarboxymuconate-semialdehyde decarboxylase
MAIDVHAHYVPKRIIEVLERRGADYGISVVGQAPACQQCLEFAYGLKVRPFLARLVEDEGARIDSFTTTGVERQILSMWTDIFGYGLPPEKGDAWHALLNEALGEVCRKHPDRFSWLASGAMQDPARAARELERCVRERGAIGGVVSANVEDVNLGELDLDEFWAAAVELAVPVLIHSAQPMPVSRTRRYGLNQVVQYTYDTTLTVGSLIFAGVLDRFPTLDLILPHGGGTVPYLIGRFDCMHARLDKAASGNAASQAPSAYLRRFHYDTIVHNPRVLRFLADSVDIDRLLVGSDDPFPPGDRAPLQSLRDAGFSAEEMHTIGDTNPRRLFRRL